MKTALVILALTTAAHADSDHSLSGTLSFSTLIRDSIDHSGGRLAAGYDLRVDRRSSLGLRGGLSMRPDGFGSVVLAFVGVRVHAWIYPGGHPIKIGGGAEVWFNFAPESDRYSEPQFVHVLAEAGPRFALNRLWFLDVPVEVGMLGFFDPPIFTASVGLQLGRQL